MSLKIHLGKNMIVDFFFSIKEKHMCAIDKQEYSSMINALWERNMISKALLQNSEFHKHLLLRFTAAEQVLFTVILKQSKKKTEQIVTINKRWKNWESQKNLVNYQTRKMNLLINCQQKKH